jgi:UDPglucose 6-dehydrogenase
VESVVAVNEGRKRAMARKVSAMFSDGLRGKTIAVLGLTFKPNTDDMREAPSLALITALQDMGAQIRAFDPAGMSSAKSILSNVIYCENAYDCAFGAHGLVIATEWEQFRALDLERVRTTMVSPIVVDLRNVYRGDELRRCGFAYASVGRFIESPATAQDSLSSWAPEGTLAPAPKC